MSSTQPVLRFGAVCPTSRASAPLANSCQHRTFYPSLLRMWATVQSPPGLWQMYTVGHSIVQKFTLRRYGFIPGTPTQRILRCGT